MSGFENLLGPFSFFVFLFALVLGVLWFLLPFAVFGTKARLDKIIAELQIVNANLEILITSEVEPIELTQDKEFTT
jgi:hypothetical protein